MIEPYYQSENVTLYCGDCREILEDIPNLHCVISDPPYGMNAKFKRDGLKSRANSSLKSPGDYVREWGKIEGDDKGFNPHHLLKYRIIALSGANHYADKLPVQDPTKPWRWLVWDKRCGSAQDDNSDAELWWTSRTGAMRIHYQKWRGIVREGEENVANGAKLHQAQKPISLMRWIIGQCDVPKDYVICDPYMGSGSTLAAAQQLGYSVIGIDLLKENCRIARERLKQQSLLAGVK